MDENGRNLPCTIKTVTSPSEKAKEHCRERQHIARLSNILTSSLIMEQFIAFVALATSVCIVMLIRIAILHQTTADANVFQIISDFQSSSNATGNFFNCFIYFSYMFIPFIFVAAMLKQNPLEIVPIKAPVNTKAVLAAIIFAFALMIAGELYANYFQYLLSFLHLKVQLDEFKFPNNTQALVWYVFQLSILAPFCEEFLFRGLILQNLRKYGNMFAILVSSALFGIIHGNFLQTPFAFLVGIALAVVVIETGSIWVSIAVHCAVNSISVLGDGLTYFYGGMASDVITNVVTILMVAAAVFVAVKLYREGYYKKAVQKYKNNNAPVSKFVLDFMKTPGCIVFIVFYAATMFLSLKNL